MDRHFTKINNHMLFLFVYFQITTSLLIHIHRLTIEKHCIMSSTYSTSVCYHVLGINIGITKCLFPMWCILCGLSGSSESMELWGSSHWEIAEENQDIRQLYYSILCCNYLTNDHANCEQCASRDTWKANISSDALLINSKTSFISMTAIKSWNWASGS